jgi:hypothetical protein
MEMRAMKRGCGHYLRRGGFLLAGVLALLIPVSAQNNQGNRETAPADRDWSRIAGNFGDVKVLPNGGPTPRMADGRPDLSGRYYPNKAGRMLQGGYRLSDDIMDQYDPAVTPQEDPVFRPETKSKYQYPTPYGICAPGGTPTSITTQATEHGPMELVQRPGVLWILTEFPQTIRWIPTDGRPHSKNPDPSFNGESVARWEGDTLVVDTIAIDERMRNISVGRRGDANAWTHSKEERVIERFTRTSQNYLTYQLEVIDPVVLVKPFISAPMIWTLAQDPSDVWTEYHCTANEDAFHYQNLAPELRKKYESGQGITGQGAN